MKRLPYAWLLASVLAVGCGEREMVTFSDFCPEQPDEVPGICGCGVPDVIDPETGSVVCDRCPNDPNKTEPGVCGCGIPDTDTNGNTIPDCLDEDVDLCPNDPNKTKPGVCGCGVPDTINPDTGMVECDLCPDDPNKTKPGLCGCGVPDIDEHGNIACAEDCDIADWDGDGVIDAEDACPYNPNITHASQGDCNVVIVNGTPQFQIWHAQDLLVMKAALENTSNPPTWTEAVIMRDLNLRDLIDPNPSIACKAQTCDVDWTPIVGFGEFRSRVLSGGGHTIRFEYQHGAKRCQLTAPLFDEINNVTVTDLVLSYDVGGDSTASLADKIYSSTLSNVHYRGDFATTNIAPEPNRYINVGGIVARSEDSTLLNLSFEGTFMVHGLYDFDKKRLVGYVGSIVGHSASDKKIHQIQTKITNFQTQGTFLSIGGTFGFLSNTGDVQHIDNQINVMHHNTNWTVDSYLLPDIGGVVGMMLSFRARSHISNVNNVVDAMVLNGAADVGGMVGFLHDASLTDVTNTIGTINGSIDDTGGLVGKVSGISVVERAVNRVNQIVSKNDNPWENDPWKDERWGNSIGGLFGSIEFLNFEPEEMGEGLVIQYIDSEVGLISGLRKNIGGLVGEVNNYYSDIYYGDEITIRHVDSRVEAVNGEEAVGGIAGFVRGGRRAITVERVASSVRRVEGVNAVGGIFGRVNYVTDSIPPSSYAQPSGLFVLNVSSQAQVFAERNVASMMGEVIYANQAWPSIQIRFTYSSARVYTSGNAIVGTGNHPSAPMLDGLFMLSDSLYYHPWPEFIATTAHFTPSADNAATLFVLQSNTFERRWHLTKTDIYGSELEVLALEPLDWARIRALMPPSPQAMR
ncbi:MAG: hypothetical protein FWC40_06300 [Proteobacteria bacterium]|nr:hypothetical protein [Pseudomonadota bacterium]